MSDERLRETLEKAFPDTPQEFHDRMLQVAQAQRKKQQDARRHRGMGVLRVALICLALLSFSTGALALMDHFGVLDIYSIIGMPPYYPLPEAEDMIQRDLATVRVGSLEWKADEAIFDGRILRILYSVRDLDAQEPFAPDADSEAMLKAMCEKEQMYLRLIGNGEVLVDGQSCNIQYMEFLPGNETGQIVGWVDCRMEGIDSDTMEWHHYLPEGYMLVEMEFGYRREKTEADPDSLSFVLKAGNAASHYAIPIPEPYTLPSGSTVTFQDLHFSPVQVYMDLTVHVPADLAPKLAPDASDMEIWDALETLPEYKATYGLRFINARDERLGESRETSYGGYRPNADGSFDLTVHTEFTPSDRYTDTVYLLLGDWKIPIPLKQ